MGTQHLGRYLGLGRVTSIRYVGYRTDVLGSPGEYSLGLCRPPGARNGAHRVPIPPNRQYRNAANSANRLPFAPAHTIDMESGGAVLEFTYRYLKAHSRPPSDREVRNVTATIARYKGSRFVLRTTLESYLSGLYDTEHI